MNRRSKLRILVALAVVTGASIWFFTGAKEPVCPVKIRFQGYTRVPGQQTQFVAFGVTNQSRVRFQFQWSAVLNDTVPAASTSPGEGVVLGHGSVEFWVLPPEANRRWRLEAKASGYTGLAARLRLRCATLCANWGWGRLANRIAPGAPKEFYLPAVPVPPEP